jgi:steroid delta-isomerase-like uncharacterized protein
MDSENTLKDIYRRIIDAISRGDADGLDELMAPDIVDHNPVPNQAPGVEGFKQWVAYARSSFPDIAGTVEDVIAEGDRVAARVTWRGTHEGTFLGIPPSGKQVSFHAFHIVRFEGDRAAEWWGTADLLSVIQQLGATVSGPD